MLPSVQDEFETPYINWIKHYKDAQNPDDARQWLEKICLNLQRKLLVCILEKALHNDAEDILQEALIAIADSIDNFRGDKNNQFLGWCCRIARNKRADFYRKHKSKVELDQFSAKEFDAFIKKANLIEAAISETIQNTDDAMRLLQMSKPKCRQLLWDRFIADMHPVAIAVQLDLKEDAVRRRIERCLKAANELASQVL